MLSFFKSFFLALSTFSKIPSPRVEWTQNNLRYLLCAFPFVGFFCGGACAIFLFLAQKQTIFGENEIAFFLTFFPIFFTGAIHFDGFLDTTDAISSRAPREKKLSILKDSHIGSFAVIASVAYFFLYFISARRFLADFCTQKIIFLTFFPVLSRFFSALSVSSFPCASNGLLKTFVDSAAKKFTLFFSIFGAIFVSFILIFFAKRFGFCAVFSQIAIFFYYYAMTKKEFGGITGDTAGWFVQTAEIASITTGAYFGEGKWFW